VRLEERFERRPALLEQRGQRLVRLRDTDGERLDLHRRQPHDLAVGTYTGTGIIEVAGTITFKNTGTTLCATNPCDFSSWQGVSGNTSMLTLATLIPNRTTAVNFTGNSETFQGSLWTQPSSQLTFGGNTETVEGPISIGSFGSGFNNASFKPLPVIKNMPVGRPIDPKAKARPGELDFAPAHSRW